MKVVSDEEQRILDCYAELSQREIVDFKSDVLAGRIGRKLARKILHGKLDVFIRFLTRGKDEYADEMTRRLERIIDKGGKDMSREELEREIDRKYRELKIQVEELLGKYIPVVVTCPECEEMFELTEVDWNKMVNEIIIFFLVEGGADDTI